VSDLDACLRQFARAAGADPDTVAGFWRDHLLHGAGKDLRAVLGEGTASALTGAVLLQPLRVHLVCPHHLTVAAGWAQLGYGPRGRVASLGHLVDVVSAATARLVLQEDAAQEVAACIVDGLSARAAVLRIVAEHPCCNVPRRAAAAFETWGEAGESLVVTELRGQMRQLVPALGPF
jgi:GTP cyclohydrolase I